MNIPRGFTQPPFRATALDHVVRSTYPLLWYDFDTALHLDWYYFATSLAVVWYWTGAGEIQGCMGHYTKAVPLKIAVTFVWHSDRINCKRPSQ